MSAHNNHGEENKESLVNQMFDESISGGAMFWTISALVVILLVVLGVIS